MGDLYVALLHHPVYDKNGAVVTTAVTNMDVHDFGRLARTYGDATEALTASKSAAYLREAGLAEDVSWCAQESILDVVPRYRGMVEYAAEVTL